MQPPYFRIYAPAPPPDFVEKSTVAPLYESTLSILFLLRGVGKFGTIFSDL